MLYITPFRKKCDQVRAGSVKLAGQRQRFSRRVRWSSFRGHSMSALRDLLCRGASTIGDSQQRYFQVRRSRNRSKGMSTRTIYWKQWYQIQQIQGDTFFLSSLRFSGSYYSKYYSTNLQAKEPLNSIAVFIVEQITDTQIPMLAARIASMNSGLPKLRRQRCEKTMTASMKPRQKFSLKTVSLDSSFSLLSCSLMSLSSLSARLALIILSPSQSSQQVSFSVLLYQFPNLRTAGVAATMTKKLTVKTKTRRERWVMKLSSRLKMISRCLRQSAMTALRVWSKTPQTLSKARTSRQKRRLRPKANQKHCLRLQLVSKNVSMPSFSTQIRIIPSVQNDSNAWCLYTSPTTSLKPTKTTRLAVVISTRDSQLENGQSFTFWYSIRITLIYACLGTLDFGFLGSLGGWVDAYSGGRKRTAPLGKKRKLGNLFLRSCMATVTSSSSTASKIIVE